MSNWFQQKIQKSRSLLGQGQAVRLVCWLVSIALVWWILLVRLIDVQLVRGDDFRQQADDNRYFSVRIPPERGVFFDRYGDLLTWNQRRYFKVDDPTAIQADWQPLDRDEALTLLATNSARVRYAWQRRYTLSSALAHVLGYVGPVTADDLLADQSLTISDQVGKSGLELGFNDQLKGQAGNQVYEIDALGQRQRLVEEKPGQPGSSFMTSLDPYLSQVAAQSLGEQSGSVIVMSADDGRVLALVNQPSFDLNLLTEQPSDDLAKQVRQQQLADLLSDERQVLFNRAISGLYPPGSVFKLVTALAGLETEAIEASTTVVDEGILKVGDYEYRNWYYSQYGRTEGEISLVKALARSNDIYFYKVAQWVGPDQLAEFAHLLGLGDKTGIELNGEATGLIPQPSWKEQTLGEPWYLGNTFHMGIGQGNILTSPLQLAQLTQAVANQGELCSARLLDTTQKTELASLQLENQEQNCAQLSLAPANLELVMQGLIQACSSGGTAYPFFAHNEESLRGLTTTDSKQQLKAGAVACKTGTAEFGVENDQGYRPTHGWLTVILDTERIQALAAEMNLEQEEEGKLEINESNLAGLTSTSASAQVDYQAWLKAIEQRSLPERLIITVLVESDETEPFKEGSDQAAVVARQVVDWMYGRAE